MIDDPVTAVLDLLKADASVTALCPANRIRAILPETAGNQPVAYITAVSAGGPAPHVWVPLLYPRLDVRCYGVSGYEAMRLARTVFTALRVAGTRQTAHSARVLDVRFETSAPLEAIEDGWPFCLWPCVLTLAELVVA